ncbi:hypothetical protein TNCV_2849761 [Trichonephila clavipes]|nr:hypothetical protein TNCV_2849761 [Trichonephila clavipes]
MSLADGQQTTEHFRNRFPSSAGLVLDVKNTCWNFDNPTHKYPFGEELDPSSKLEKMSSNTWQLAREGESEKFDLRAQKEKLTSC